MITIDLVISSVHGLTRAELDRWIAAQWVHADMSDDTYVFAEIDLARIRLIHELTTDLAINDDALPVVLSLLDQIHDLRRHLRTLLADRPAA